MRMLGKSWEDGYLDYSKSENDVRVAVNTFIVLDEVKNIYFEREKSLYLVFNYIKEYGLKSTFNKIRSRSAEGLRNNKYLGIGLGRVLEEDGESKIKKDSLVLFIAPSHPRCFERVVLNKKLVKQVNERDYKELINTEHILWGEGKKNSDFDELYGWQEESGIPLSEGHIEPLFDTIEKVLKNVDVSSLTCFSINPLSEVVTTSRATNGKSKKLTGSLFGYGNYAKTQILENISDEIRVDMIHEIDPTQIGKVEGFKWPVSSNPHLSENEKYDITFIAGYHHTHADLAVRSLERGGYVVVEKPVVTTMDDFHRLADVIKKFPERLFAGFHMRYNPLTQNLWNDLGVKRGSPVNYFCTVFEVPLPDRHWYRWPNSCGHIISNGCHWLDHYLFVNDYSKPIRTSVVANSNNSQVWVELENSATMGMQLTHVGSSRLGVRDHVEMRTGDRTAILESGSLYTVENNQKILVRKKENRMNSYRAMYSQISRDILDGNPGDSFDSFYYSNNLVLTLDKMHKKAICKGKCETVEFRFKE